METVENSEYRRRIGRSIPWFKVKIMLIRQWLTLFLQKRQLPIWDKLLQARKSQPIRQFLAGQMLFSILAYSFIGVCPIPLFPAIWAKHRHHLRDLFRIASKIFQFPANSRFRQILFAKPFTPYILCRMCRVLF